MADKVAKVLLVEDDEDDYILTSDYLHQLDSHTFEIDWVTRPEEALEQLKRNVHDICLLDYQLGALNGLTVLEKATNSGCVTPIIMLTGQSDATLDKAALTAGAADYLVKGDISTARFDRTIRYALARKEVENERVERIKAESENRSKDRFLAHLSHELRTPLTSILGYTEILLGSDKCQQAQSELNVILNNGRHLLGLLNNVLDLSKLAAGKLELSPSEIKLENFIADIFSLMQVHAKDKGIQLSLRCETQLPLYIKADPIRLRQILINLIHNAIKFTDYGDVKLEMSVVPLKNQEMMCFKVVDTGQGIPNEKLDSIFKPFEQVEDIISRKEEGAGLGLAICAELVKHMGGTIKVESEVDTGSCFTVIVDTQIDPSLAKNRPNFKVNHTSEFLSTFVPIQGRVLVVDDMDDIRALIGHFCQSFGLVVEYATNGLQALEKIKDNSRSLYDLVLMDIHMPQLDGRRAILEIRKLAIEIPILAITAATMKGIKQELQQLGFDGIISKPIDKKALYSELRSRLDSEKPSLQTPFSLANDDFQGQLSQDKKQILLVEDDHDAATVTKLLLESLGCEVDIAESAQQALELMTEAKKWGQILLDVNLPDGDGLTLASQVQLTRPESKIVLLSGAEVDAKELAKLGIDRAILKPVNLEILKSLLD